MFRFALCGVAALTVGFVGGWIVTPPAAGMASAPYVPTITVPSTPAPGRRPSPPALDIPPSAQTKAPAIATGPPAAGPARVAAEPSPPPRRPAAASRRGKKVHPAVAAKKPGGRSARLARRTGCDDDDHDDDC